MADRNNIAAKIGVDNSGNKRTIKAAVRAVFSLFLNLFLGAWKKRLVGWFALTVVSLFSAGLIVVVGLLILLCADWIACIVFGKIKIRERRSSRLRFCCWVLPLSVVIDSY